MLWLDMGMGKGVCTLTAVQQLIEEMKVYRVLVLAPKRVAQTVWRQEIAAWTHLSGLRPLLLEGPKADLVHMLHRPEYNVHVINYESIPKLVSLVNEYYLSRGFYPPWNCVVFDEVDRLKDAGGKRFQILEKLVGKQKGGGTYFPYRYGLTGTPASQSYIDLHGQFLMVDDGERLYPGIGSFRTVWCRAGYGERSWEIRAESKAEIESRVQDITLSMKGEDYLQLPDYQVHDHWIDLDPKMQVEYDRLETEMFAQLARHEDDPLDGDYELAVHTSMTARSKCRQIANGAFLTPENIGEVVLLHDAKLEMLDSIMHEAAGRPVLLSYQFRHDMERIKKRYTKQGYKVGYIGPGTKDVEEMVRKWNAKEYHLLISHAASAGVGLNLQLGGNEIVWFGLTDNLRYYLQMNARLRRQGQAAPNVHVRRILARNTVDVPIAASLEVKTASEEGLRAAIKAYQEDKEARWVRRQ